METKFINPVKITVVCKSCGTSITITVEKVDLDRYNNHQDSVQNIFPYLTSSERELLLSGLCDHCFHKITYTGEYDYDEPSIKKEYPTGTKLYQIDLFTSDSDPFKGGEITVSAYLSDYDSNCEEGFTTDGLPGEEFTMNVFHGTKDECIEFINENNRKSMDESIILPERPYYWHFKDKED